MVEEKKCTQCGFCKYSCPVFNVLLNEKYSPRGKMINIKDLDEVAYYCTLCKACENECPIKLEVPEKIREERKAIVEKGKETESNKTMIENVRKYGNPFGEVEKGKKPKDLYCC